MRGGDLHRLVVEHPVGDIFDAGGRQMIDGIEGLAQTGAFPATRRPAGKAADRLNGFGDDRRLVIDVVHGPLDKAVAHELPARLESGRRDAGDSWRTPSR